MEPRFGGGCWKEEEKRVDQMRIVGQIFAFFMVTRPSQFSLKDLIGCGPARKFEFFVFFQN
jgi:hypothetical protein